MRYVIILMTLFVGCSTAQEPKTDPRVARLIGELSTLKANQQADRVKADTELVSLKDELRITKNQLVVVDESNRKLKKEIVELKQVKDDLNDYRKQVNARLLKDEDKRLNIWAQFDDKLDGVDNRLVKAEASIKMMITNFVHSVAATVPTKKGNLNGTNTKSNPLNTAK